jgi:hypothetical protein
MRGIRRDITLQRFGRLVAVRPTERRDYRAVVWELQCDCGRTHYSRVSSLTSGRVTSCGCLNRDVHTTHGQTNTPEFEAFCQAKYRCENPAHEAWEDYGGRGIEFRFKSFEEFIAHIGARPSADMILDRIDNDGHYEIGNVRWVTYAVSNQNKRSTKLSPAKVVQIREMYAAGGINQIEIARRFGVRDSLVSRVVTKKIWKNVGELAA